MNQNVVNLAKEIFLKSISFNADNNACIDEIAFLSICQATRFYNCLKDVESSPLPSIDHNF